MKPVIVPVIDLLDGRVVRGVAGRRSEYRPISSPWSKRAEPIEIMRGIQREWGLDEFYVADLDAIQHDRPNWDIYASLIDAGATLMLDAGIRDVGRARELVVAGIQRIVVALETLDDPRSLSSFVSELGSQRLVFSLDLRNGQPLARGEWERMQTMEIVNIVARTGFRSLIVLDLAGVGVGQGIPTLPLCHAIRQSWPALEIITGGGVRNASDIAAARECGVDSVLVASALHDGRLRKEELIAMQ